MKIYTLTEEQLKTLTRICVDKLRSKTRKEGYTAYDKVADAVQSMIPYHVKKLAGE